jgi:hypothetical protein
MVEQIEGRWRKTKHKKNGIDDAALSDMTYRQRTPCPKENTIRRSVSGRKLASQSINRKARTTCPVKADRANNEVERFDEADSDGPLTWRGSRWHDP